MRCVTQGRIGAGRGQAGPLRTEQRVAYSQTLTCARESRQDDAHGSPGWTTAAPDKQRPSLLSSTPPPRPQTLGRQSVFLGSCSNLNIGLFLPTERVFVCLFVFTPNDETLYSASRYLEKEAAFGAHDR